MPNPHRHSNRPLRARNVTRPRAGSAHPGKGALRVGDTAIRPAATGRASAPHAPLCTRPRHAKNSPGYATEKAPARKSATAPGTKTSSVAARVRCARPADAAPRPSCSAPALVISSTHQQQRTSDTPSTAWRRCCCRRSSTLRPPAPASTASPAANVAAAEAAWLRETINTRAAAVAAAPSKRGSSRSGFTPTRAPGRYGSQSPSRWRR